MPSREPDRLLRVPPVVALSLVGFALNGCGGGGTGLTFPPTTGTLQVTTSTSGDEPDPDGYTLQLDGDVPEPIGVAGTFQRTEVQPGDHTLRLDGMAPNCSVAENPRTVSIVAGETQTSSFEISCTATSGGVVITTTTTGASSDPDGYSVVLDGVEQGPIPVNGQITLSGLALGNHVVGLGGVAGNCQLQGENLRAVTVTPAGSTPVDYAVTCSAPPPNAGTLRVITVTTGNSPDPDGYTFALDGGPNQPIAVNAVYSIINLAPGSHRVQLSGLSENCRVQGSGSRNVNVAAGGSSDVTFAVLCARAAGSIRVTVSTSGSPGDPNGYRVLLDNAGPGLSVDEDGSVRFNDVPVGSHTIMLDDVAGNCSVDEGPARSVAVTTGGVAEVRFRVVCVSAGSNRLRMVSGDNQTAPAGAALPERLVVQVTDPSGNPVPAVTIEWTAEGGGSVSTSSTQTDGNGMASVTRTLGPNVGKQGTRASAAGLAGSPVTFTHRATAGEAAKLEMVSGNDQEGAPGTTLQDPLVVRVTDAADNPVSGVSVQWTVEGGGSVSQELTVTDENGRASVTRTLGPNAGPQSTQASVDGLSGSPVTFNHTATPTKSSSNMTITRDDPDPSAPGQAVSVTVRVTGSGGTPTGEVLVEADDSDPCTIILDAGSGSCDIILNTGGDGQTITATYSGDAAFTGSSDRESHDVNSPPEASFSWASCVANEPCEFTDTSTDPDGNVTDWHWDFDDGTDPETVQSPQHTFAASGEYHVRLTVRDDHDVSDEATNVVTVGPAANTAPTANDDDYTTIPGVGFHAPGDHGPSLLDNDWDPEGDDLFTTAESKDTEELGNVVIGSDGSFDYVPPVGFLGTDRFEYSVSDSKGATSTAHARILVASE